ncbi:MAG: hypothetical protein J6S23_02460 [Clostridia bacterium]|nr:hypothetical protein [Clostridia bacterium]
MTDHKFTDEQIIKALEVCAKNTVGREGYFTYQGIPLRYLCEDALALINRQKAEIERIERHTEMYHELRAEAIKEFAERLKSDLGRIPQYHFTRSEVEWSINTLEKEMTEENK